MSAAGINGEPLLLSEPLTSVRSQASEGTVNMKITSSREHLHGARRCNIAAIVCMLLAITGIITTTVIHDVIQNQLQSGLAQQYVLDSPNAGSYAAWIDSDNPDAGSDYTDFYVYHINNPYEVAVLGAKPNVTEIGPLHYVFNQKKYNVTWDPMDDGDIVSYNQWQYYTAADDATRAFENMTVTTTNVPLLGAMHNSFAQQPGADVLLALLLELNGYTDPMALFVNRTAYDVIWGWEDPLLTLIKADGHIPTPTYYPGVQENDSSLAVALSRHGTNRIYTGKYTANLAREYVEWDGMDQLECCAFGPCGDSISGPFPVLPFATQEAELIHGGFGEQFHQFITSDETLRVNSMAFGIFRTWDMVNAGSESYSVNGINLLKFTWAPYVLGNMTTAPEDAFAYNAYGPAGLLNQSQCEWGARIFISKPRFLDGSPSLRDGIANLLPASDDSHGTWLGVEPYTGQTMDFHWRVGVNVYVAPDSLGGVPFFASVSPVFIPMVWADRYATIDDSQASQFKSKVYVAANLIAAARWGGIALACVAFVASAAFFYVAALRRRRLEEAREVESGLYWADQFRPFLTPDGLQAVYAGGDGSIQHGSGSAGAAAPSDTGVAAYGVLAGDDGGGSAGRGAMTTTTVTSPNAAARWLSSTAGHQ